MISPELMKYVVYLMIVLAFVNFGFAQAPARHPGIVLFEQAKFSEAVRSLENASKSKQHRSDADIWNYLGLAYLAKDKIKNARKAFEQSVKLNPTSSAARGNLAYAYLLSREVNKAMENAERAIQLDPKNPGAYHVRAIVNFWGHKLDPAEMDADSFINLDPGHPDGYILKVKVLLAKLAVMIGSGKTIKEERGFLKRAIETLEIGSAKVRGSRSAELKAELESLTVFYDYFSRDSSVTPAAGAAPNPSITPYRIISKPRPSYTDRARNAGVEGTIQVKVLLGTSGRVEYVLPLTRLGYGLDEQAIIAAKQITFEPKKKDGKPVPVVVTLEYSFSIY